jgi:ABC-type glycerol-3-phosphate transport system substrate-binding protein
MATGVDLPDMIYLNSLNSQTLVNMADLGMLVPIQDILEYSDGTAKEFYSGEGAYTHKLNTFADGKTYIFSNTLSTFWNGELAFSPDTTLIRKDWFEALDLPVPDSAESFFQTLKAFRDLDANGNDEKDELLLVDSTFYTSINGWFDLGSELVYVDSAKQQVLSPWYQPGIKDYITYLKRFVDEGLLDVSAIADYDRINAENKISC